MVDTDGIHLAADTKEELHKFGKALAIENSHYTEAHNMPRYFLPAGTLRKAMKAGAQHTSPNRLAQVSKGSWIHVELLD